jgi:long-chain acyl-CoA synthetase
MQQQPWWKDVAAVQRFVIDLVTSELALLRPGQPRPAIREWDDAIHLVESLGMDSLEMLSVATSLTQAVHLHESGIEDYLLARHTLGEWVGIVTHGLDAYSSNLTFRTSGSTGAPKSCCHSLIALWQEVEELAALYSGCQRIISVVPSHHLYGFLHTILLPQVLVSTASPVLDARGMTAPQLARILRKGDLIVGFPDWWRMATHSGTRFPEGVRGVVSTAPCSAELHAAVLEAGVACLYDIFGSSETAGIGWREDASAPYRLFSYWQQDPALQGLVRKLPDGTLIRATSQDAIRWNGPREFTMGRRLDQAVQVGGVNVFPARVRTVLLEHPLVKDAAVRLMHPQEGSRLKAFIVLNDGVPASADTRRSLEDWVRQRLRAAELPRAFTFGAVLPVSPAGKPQDWALDSSPEPAIM